MGRRRWRRSTGTTGRGRAGGSSCRSRREHPALLIVDTYGDELGSLQRPPTHELKIDQTFVAGMLADPQDEVIVRSTIDLGHNLGLQVVAEGVESMPVLDRLAQFGCDVAQGFGIASPMSVDALVGGAPTDWVADMATAR